MPAPPLPSLAPAIIALLGCDCLDIEPIPRPHPTRNLNTNIRYTLFHVNSPINLILLRHDRPALVLGRPSSLSTTSRLPTGVRQPYALFCPAALPCRPALPCLHTMSQPAAAPLRVTKAPLLADVYITRRRCGAAGPLADSPASPALTLCWYPDLNRQTITYSSPLACSRTTDGLPCRPRDETREQVHL
jgi:hypothetical protein